MTTFLLSAGVLAIMAVFLGLRVIFAKDTEVRKPGCANARLFMDEQEACPVCGVTAAEDCAQPAATPAAATSGEAQPTRS